MVPASGSGTFQPSMSRFWTSTWMGVLPCCSATTSPSKGAQVLSSPMLGWNSMFSSSTMGSRRIAATVAGSSYGASSASLARKVGNPCGSPMTCVAMSTCEWSTTRFSFSSFCCSCGFCCGCGCVGGIGGDCDASAAASPARTAPGAAPCCSRSTDILSSIGSTPLAFRLSPFILDSAVASASADSCSPASFFDLGVGCVV
mmetsp:Transcript_3852/g.11140  ORF Transcript_3852/g.11140 Transcript_3852/m.11140 type:complete len:201 (+) Transcript_3852:2871-3473(+)